MTRRWTLTLGAVIATLLLAACGGAPAAPSAPTGAAPEAAVTTAPAESAPAGQNLFTIAYPTTFPDLDPSTSFSNDNAILANVYEPLVWYSPEGGGKTIPGLAERWESSPDSTEWTFYLRKGASFHDGTPFNAEAVKFSIERTKELNGGAAWIWGAVNKIEAKDESTVVMTLDYPLPLDLVASSGYAAWMISPKAADKDAAWFNAGNDAGTGPYRIESYEAGARAVLGRYEDYWGGWKPGQFDKVVLEVVEDPTVRQQKIESGEADWVYDLPTENLATLEERPEVKIVTNPAYQNLVGLLNTQKKPLDDPKVRQALSYSFPYEVFIDSAMAGYATQSTGVIPKGMPGHDDQLKQYSFDPEQAKALLKEAGHENGGFELSMTYAAGNTVQQQAGELWKAELAKLGITLNLQPMAWEAQWGLAKGDPTQAQDIFVMYWWPTYVTPYDFLFNMFHSEEQPNFNLGYYKNPAFDKLIDDANAQLGTDREAALKQFSQAQQALIDDAASIFFFDQVNIHAVREDVKGYVDNPAYAHVVFAYQLSR